MAKNTNRPRDIPEGEKVETSQNFVLQLYVESDDYNTEEVLSRLPLVFTDYCYIIHDMDEWTKEDEKEDATHVAGMKKKAHIHIYGKRSQCRVTTVANLLGISPRWVRITHNRKAAIRYLQHLDHPERWQYQLEEVVTNFDIEKFCVHQCEEQRVMRILDFVTSGKRSVRETCLYAMENNCWSEFRRSYTIIKDIMKEVN